MKRQIPFYTLLYSCALLLSWQWHTCNGFTLGGTRDKTRTEFRFSRWTTTSTTDTAAAVIATPIKAVESKRRTSYLSASLEETNQDILSAEFNTISNNNDDDNDDLILPRHATNEEANQILSKAQSIIETMQTSLIQNKEVESLQKSNQKIDIMGDGGVYDGMDNVAGVDRVYSNSYVDLGKVDTVGFDFDYTLVTYTNELLEVIYDMTLNRLVHKYQYPPEMLQANMTFDPKFSIRGLAVDRETGWICHLSYTHKVAVAWEGRNKVPREVLMQEYTGKRSLRPNERKKRLKPLNDLFSMAECCLIADVVQFFKERNIPFCPRNAVHDTLDAIRSTHISGDFHRLVAKSPEMYFEQKPYLKEVLQKLKDSGKRLIFVSNSPFWYVDAGMKHVIGDDWRDMWDTIIVSAGKPRFYTDDKRPFREVSSKTGRIKFKKVTEFEPGEVYSEGCLSELTKCLRWNAKPSDTFDTGIEDDYKYESALASPNVLYIGDSLFADLVDAKRNFGWTTAAVTPEVGYEIALQEEAEYMFVQYKIDIMVSSLRKIQTALGNGQRTADDIELIDILEGKISVCREQQNSLLGNPFGSVFRARYQPSLFAHSLRRYCDLYMPSIDALRNYSPQHRFYPEDARLLSHENGMKKSFSECYDFEELFPN